jgi:lipopolysaccharide transport system ATP-binding protein
MDELVVVKKVGKRFVRYHPSRPKTFKASFIGGFRLLKPVARFWALRDVSFSVGKGQICGVIGPNGAGKSTLLQLVGGVLRPEEGSIIVKGRVASLIELGSTFHDDLTGRENVLLYGVVAGNSRKEIFAEVDAITEFAELDEFIDNPVRTYSSGMRMRLAFAAATNRKPDILLIDEVFAVGDTMFKKKCVERIIDFKEQGSVILLVSHSMDQVKEVCDHAILLHRGQLITQGDPDEVVDRYYALILDETKKRTPITAEAAVTQCGKELRINENRFGSLEVEIKKVVLKNSLGLPLGDIYCGDPLTVEIDFLTNKAIKSPNFVINICDDRGRVYCSMNNVSKQFMFSTIEGKCKIALHIDRLDLNVGEYYVDVGIYDSNWSYAYDFHCQVYSFFINSTINNVEGIISPPHRWELI